MSLSESKPATKRIYYLNEIEKKERLRFKSDFVLYMSQVLHHVSEIIS